MTIPIQRIIDVLDACQDREWGSDRQRADLAAPLAELRAAAATPAPVTIEQVREAWEDETIEIKVFRSNPDAELGWCVVTGEGAILMYGTDRLAETDMLSPQMIERICKAAVRVGKKRLAAEAAAPPKAPR